MAVKLAWCCWSAWQRIVARHLLQILTISARSSEVAKNM